MSKQSNYYSDLSPDGTWKYTGKELAEMGVAVTKRPIDETSKDGGYVYVSNENHPEWGEHLMCWSKSKKLWCGFSFMPMGKVKTCWAAEYEQPTHYRTQEDWNKDYRNG